MLHCYTDHLRLPLWLILLSLGNHFVTCKNSAFTPAWKLYRVHENNGFWVKFLHTCWKCEGYISRLSMNVPFLVAPSLRAERLIWSLWRVSGCTFVSHRGTPTPTPGNHRISKIPKPKFVSAHSEQLFQGGPPPPLSKGKNSWHWIWLDTCSDWKKKFLQKKFLAKFFLRPFHRISWTIC